MIVVATAEEKEHIQSLYGDKEILVTGVGALNVYKSLNGISRNTPILNLGYAGSNNIPIGSIVSVGESRLYHPNVDYCEDAYQLNGKVLCLTSCDFVLCSEEKNCVFDMELAFILAMGFKHVRSYKKVSDSLNMNEYIENVCKSID